VSSMDFYQKRFLPLVLSPQFPPSRLENSRKISNSAMSANFSSPDSAAIEKQVDVVVKALKLSDVWTANDLNRSIKFIREKFLSRICLQFSDEILHLSVEIEGQLRKHVDSNIFILADTSYGSCCVDEVSHRE
jgi:hypothetical protein